MIYKDFKGKKLSALGFGTMRLPLKEDGTIDRETAAEMVDVAIKNGVNYFDTAYGYHNGESELFNGEALAKYPRDSFYLASKFPGYQVRESWDPKAVFEEQLEKCGVDYFDFYLLHTVSENTMKNYLSPKWGIIDYLMEQKKNGRIKHFGFSFHTDTETLKYFLDLHGDKMEFCQIQLNSLDWTLQDAKEKYELLRSRGIPMWVMEPVRGGRLASFPDEKEALLKAQRPDESIAAWSFRWLQTLPGVDVVLSGMTTMEHVQDNIKTYAEDKPLTDEEKKLYDGITADLADVLPCTTCKYCLDSCPQGLDIPRLLALYDNCRFFKAASISMLIDAMEPDKKPSACIACGACSEQCPQKIDIPAALQHFQSMLDTMPHFVMPAE